MKSQIILWNLILILGISSCTEQPQSVEQQNEILPSWNDGTSKQEIIDFVTRVTDKNSVDYIDPAQRIATFDNDGTLWAEQPVYFQLFFAIDRIKAMANEHPEWDTLMPYSAVLQNDMSKLLSTGEKGLIQLILTSHSNLTTKEFEEIVKQWAASAEHPQLHRKYSDLVYQPMLELLRYLQNNEFKTYIVSGGGVDFMRPIVSDIYNIPPEQIIGTTLKSAYSYNIGNPQIMKLPEVHFVDDKAGKPENIQRIIGRRPVISVGNSDGDLAMLQWASGQETFLNVYVHHTDGEREWAYDRNSHIGKLDKGLDQAEAEKWTVIDMKNDWKVIYPFELK